MSSAGGRSSLLRYTDKNQFRSHKSFMVTLFASIVNVSSMPRRTSAVCTCSMYEKDLAASTNFEMFREPRTTTLATKAFEDYADLLLLWCTCGG